MFGALPPQAFTAADPGTTAIHEASVTAGYPEDGQMVFFGEIDRASSSFSGGRPALPVEVRPEM
jgi:hypothetical protein